MRRNRMIGLAAAMFAGIVLVGICADAAVCCSHCPGHGLLASFEL